MSELADGEALLVHAFRCTAAALTDSERADWSDVEGTLGRMARPGQRDAAVRAFASVIRVIGGEARAAVRFHVPGCPCLGRHEAIFVALCERVNAGQSGQAQATAQRLIHDRAIPRLLRRCNAFLARVDGLSATEGDAFSVTPKRAERAHGARLH